MTENDLKKFRGKRREVSFARWSLQNMEQSMGYPLSADPADMKTKTGHGLTISSVESAAETKLRLQTQYRTLLESYDAEALSIEAALKMLTPDERSVIRAYYLQGCKWADVCEKLHFSWSQVQRLKKSAIRKLTCGGGK